MNIVWITSEAFPYIKTGGLADVSGALPKALAERGHKVAVIMPYCPQLMKGLTARTHVVKNTLGVPFGWSTEWVQLREDRISENLSFYFIEYNLYFDRPALYDWYGKEFGDNAARFIFFSRAAMQAILALEIKPDIIHTNDWPSALCNLYLRTPLYWGYDNFRDCRSVLTIHNIGYQGTFDKSNLFLTGLGWEYFNHTCLEYHDRLNFLKAGIMTADMVNAVSPTYAEEILRPEYGFTLDPVLQHIKHRNRLRGILNGIDVNEWNPQTDKLLPANFSADDLHGKSICKVELQKEFDLPQKPDVPLLGIVSRLANQKGIDVFGDCIEDMLYHDNIQVAVLGTGDPGLEGHLSYLNGKYPDKFSVYIGYNNRLAHMIEAGSDFFVMPSRYEPCGLNQMYSMRYGTVPIARGTGGLEDTIVNYSEDNLGNSNGFKFYILDSISLRNTLRWAVSIYLERPDKFYKMIRNGMMADFSWDKTASQYEAMYEDCFRQ
jgi:starch synthase